MGYTFQNFADKKIEIKKSYSKTKSEKWGLFFIFGQ